MKCTRLDGDAGLGRAGKDTAADKLMQGSVGSAQPDEKMTKV